MQKSLLLLIVILSVNLSTYSQVSFGNPSLLNAEWKFQKGDFENAALPEFDDSRWRTLNLPHDWSVEGPYSPDLASATGYLPGGIGWYRKQINISKANENQRIYIYFEGVYRNGEVFINGQSLGMRPNGYISYMYDLTPHIKFDQDNTIAVRVDHSEYADSRWYTGSGIYRDVWLIEANPIHVDQWGIYYTTPEITTERAKVLFYTTVTNHTRRRASVTVTQQVLDKNNREVASVTGRLRIGGNDKETIIQNMDVNNPEFWSINHPHLYTLNTTVYHDDQIIDQNSMHLGIRTLEFDPNKGFALNGEFMNLKGVCLHHDAGSLGAAVPREVWKRRLLILKELGTNAIRTSHNPQATDLYELCDELGLLVINEAFDEWEFPKKKWIEGWNQGTPGFQGHADFFKEWADIDLKEMILRDRNHPSVFMWSIGNEVDYPNDPYSHPILDEQGIGQQHVSGFQPNQPHADRLGAIAQRLAAIVREYDPTRPVTAGLAGPVMSNETDYPDALDVVGYNYTEGRYEHDHAKYPNRVFYGSENGHSLNAWKYVRDNDYIFAQFLWTGIDYLGESHRWPSRGFTSGLLDLGGNMKPRAYFRKSLWADAPMVYLGTYSIRGERRNLSIDALPNWNYSEGQTIRVVSYTNCEEVQLMLNGEKIGVPISQNDDSGIIHWDIPYSPGKLEAIGFINGQESARYNIVTSDRPQAIKAKVWNNQTSIDRNHAVAQIELEVVDKNGHLVILAGDEITCAVSGPFQLLGMEASNPRDMGDYKNNSLRVFNGKMIVYIQTTGEQGEGTVTFTAPWLDGVTIDLKSE